MDSAAPAPASSSPNVKHGDIADHSQIHCSVYKGITIGSLFPFFVRKYAMKFVVGVIFIRCGCCLKTGSSHAGLFETCKLSEETACCVLV